MPVENKSIPLTWEGGLSLGSILIQTISDTMLCLEEPAGQDSMSKQDNGLFYLRAELSVSWASA